MAKASAKQSKKQTEGKNIEREYVIPLREGFRQKPIYKKTPAAVKTIKKFLVRHMKIRDRDLDKIKINKYLNEYLWFRGIKKPPAKVKVRAVKEEAGTENEKIRVYLVDIPEKLNFKQKREEKLIKQAEEKAKEKEPASAKTASAKTSEGSETSKTSKKTTGSKEETKEEIVEDIQKGGGDVSKKVAEKEEKLDEKETEKYEKEQKDKEKKDSAKETKSKPAKESHKKQKHTSGGKHKDQTSPKRQALKK